jgi:hypothetical protein
VYLLAPESGKAGSPIGETERGLLAIFVLPAKNDFYLYYTEVFLFLVFPERL